MRKPDGRPEGRPLQGRPLPGTPVRGRSLDRPLRQSPWVLVALMKTIVHAAAMAIVACAALSAYDPLPQDTGAAGTYQKLLKLKTIASVMHTTAHPDDEHGGLLAGLSRGTGPRGGLL